MAATISLVGNPSGLIGPNGGATNLSFTVTLIIRILTTDTTTTTTTISTQ